jgi:hypothetical protein
MLGLVAVANAEGAVVVVCSRCGKENQAHYKFCLGCGGELTRDAAPAASRPASKPVQDPLGLASFLEKERPAQPGDASPGPVAPAPGGAPAPRDLGAAGNAARSAMSSARSAVAPGVPDTSVPADPGAKPMKWKDVGTAQGQAPARGSRPAPADDAVAFAPPAPIASTGGGAAAARAPAPAPAPSPSPAAARPASTPAVDMRQSSALGLPALRDEPRSTDPDMAPAAQAPGTRPCPKCGTPSPTDFVFCGACGARMEQAAPGPVAPAAPRRRLLLIRPDGSEGGQFPLLDGENLVGRSVGAPFETDSFLSPRHAMITLSGDRIVIRDNDSLNGVFVKLRREVELIGGDVFRIGQELLRFDEIGGPRTTGDGTEVMGSPNPGFWGRLTVMVGRNVDGNSYPLLGPQVLLGRERGDILFSEDGYVSGTHAKLAAREGRVLLADLGSSNGTFLRIRQETSLGTGDFVLLGQQLFRIDPM